MKSPKTYLILLLALTTVGGAVLAWQQYQELVDLRGAAVNKDERAELQKRIWDLEKLNRELNDQLAALRTVDLDSEGMASAESPASNRDRGSGRGESRGEGRGRGGPSTSAQQAAIRDLLAKPEVQAMISAQRKLAIEERYAALFRGLNLSPEQSDKLKTLLAERQNTMQDVLAVAREQGVDPRSNPEAFRKLLTDARNEVNGSIKSLLGDSGYAQLQSYEQTMPQRAVVDQLQQRLSYGSNPLTPSQADQLVQILAANAPARTVGQGGGSDQPRFGGRGPDGPAPGGFPGRGGDLGALAGAFLGGNGMALGAVLEAGRGGGGAPITPAALNQAQGVLSQPQLSALQQLQQQQQNTQQLRQLVSETISASQPAGSTKSGTTPAGGTPRRRGGGGG